MDLKDVIRQAKQRFNQYGQDLEEVSRHAQERRHNYNRNNDHKMYEGSFEDR